MARATVARLRDLANSLPPNSPFPSERDLVRDLGVSRTTIRQALHVLEEQNQLVRIGRIGRYTPSVPTPLTLSGSTKEEREARAIYESALIKSLAETFDQNNSSSLLKFLESHLKAVSEVPETEHGQVRLAKLNTEFHLKVAEFHSNDRLVTMLHLAIDHASQQVFRVLDKEVIALQHKMVVHAILLGDPTLADRSMALNLAYELALS